MQMLVIIAGKKGNFRFETPEERGVRGEHR